jgi:hypothetical protein
MPAMAKPPWSRRPPATVVREYPGADQRDAVRRFSADAAPLLDVGYRVVSYQWRSSGRAMTAPMPGVLSPRHGTLRVTYGLQSTAVARDPSPFLTAAPPGVAAELIDLLAARSRGVIDETQFSAMRRRLVKRD